MEGSIKKGELFKFMANKEEYNAEDVGFLRMDYQPTKELKAGEVGYIIGSVKSLSHVRVGDTITTVKILRMLQFPGYQEAKPMGFSGIFPTNSEDFEDLRTALEKLQLNDASLSYEPETSKALGFGFRAGFLGLLHMEIVQERLDREFNIDIITTVPNVQYEVKLETGEVIEVDNLARCLGPVILTLFTSLTSKPA